MTHIAKRTIHRATALNVCSTTLNIHSETGVKLDKKDWHEYLCIKISRNKSRK